MTWHVATVSSRREASAVHDMQAIGIEAYYPKQARWKRTAKGKRRVEFPVIPGGGYVFFQLNEAEEEQYIDTCDGVTGVLTCGLTEKGDRKLAVIPDTAEGNWVDRTREAEERGDFDATIDRSVKLKAGDRVKIVAGAFAGMLASITKATKREFRVEVDGVGKLKGHKVTLAKADVADVKEAA